MSFILHLVLALCLVNPVMAQNKVKNINLKIDELGVVKTAVGIATIIQFNEPIQTVIIGDQSAFKIEYLDKTITIKPLRYSAKTNMYVNTMLRRYNLNLQTTQQELSDYVVYVKNKDEKIPSSTKWKNLLRKSQANGVVLKLFRVGKTTDGHVLLDLKMTSTTQQKIEPEHFWLLQAKEAKVINSVFMSSDEIRKDKPLSVGISLNLKDLVSDLPAILEVRFKEVLRLELPREVLWKN